MLIAHGREFSHVTVAEFKRLRKASLESIPHGGPATIALREFLQKHRVKLGQLHDLEQYHDQQLGPDFFNRPPWTS